MEFSRWWLALAQLKQVVIVFVRLAISVDCARCAKRVVDGVKILRRLHDNLKPDLYEPCRGLNQPASSGELNPMPETRPAC